MTMISEVCPRRSKPCLSNQLTRSRPTNSRPIRSPLRPNNLRRKPLMTTTITRSPLSRFTGPLEPRKLSLKLRLWSRRSPHARPSPKMTTDRPSPKMTTARPSQRRRPSSSPTTMRTSPTRRRQRPKNPCPLRPPKNR